MTIDQFVFCITEKQKQGQNAIQAQLNATNNTLLHKGLQTLPAQWMMAKSATPRKSVFMNLGCSLCAETSFSTKDLSVALGNQHSSSSSAMTPIGCTHCTSLSTVGRVIHFLTMLREQYTSTVLQQYQQYVWYPKCRCWLSINTFHLTIGICSIIFLLTQALAFLRSREQICQRQLRQVVEGD